MGADLHAASPAFAAAFDQACALLETELGVPVAEVVLGGDSMSHRVPQRGRNGTSSPSRGARGSDAVRAGGVVRGAGGAGGAAGRGPGSPRMPSRASSVGEIGAAYAAGVLSLEAACTLVAARARLMQALPDGGAMTAIAASEAEAIAALADVPGVSVAAVNGPSSVVISGDAAAVDQVAEGFASAGRRVRRLRVSHAFHSHRMDALLTELGQVAARLDARRHACPGWARCPASRSANAAPGTGPAKRATPVRFADAMARLATTEEISVFIEIEPDGTLSALGPAALPDEAGDQLFVSVLRPSHPAPPRC